MENEKKVSSLKNVTGSEALILSLLEEGVDTIFGYPGGAIMPIYDALYDYLDRINHYLTRHEQGAIHSAEAFAKVTRKPGIVFATSGPGATNLITGLSNAQIDSTPLVCITGQVSSGLLGFDAFQESDVVGISMPVTKWNFQVTRPEEVAEAVAKAFYIATTGRPGPVLIDITKDAQLAKTDFKYNKIKSLSGYYPYPKIKLDKVREAANLINNAKKPLILAGQGVLISNAQTELESFINKTGIPVACTMLGLASISTKHPLYQGMLGMHGNYAPNVLTNEADLIIAIGMRFDDRVTSDTKTYATKAKVIHIDIDPAEINKNVAVRTAIISDAKRALKELLPLVKENKYDDWTEEFKKLKKIEYKEVIEKDIYPKIERIRPAEVVHLISEKTNGDAIVVTDVGQHQMMAARYFNLNTSNSFITSGGLGTMGFGLPASFGAAIGQPDKQVIAFVGDGGFQMTIQELATIWQHKVNVKIVMLNNSFLGMVRQWQELFFEKRYSFTTMTNPDFVAIVKGFGIEANKVTERKKLKSAIDKMLAHDSAYFLEVVTEKEDNVFPMIASGASVSDMMLTPNDNSNK